MSRRHFPARFRGGFTLIEIILVLGIIVLLSYVTIAAINPARQLGKAYDTQRSSDVLTILNAVYQYSIDKGSLPPGIPQDSTAAVQVCQFDTPLDTCAALPGLNLRMLSGTYLVNMPRDPKINTAGTGTYYKIYQNLDSRLTVYAMRSDGGQTITVSR